MTQVSKSSPVARNPISVLVVDDESSVRRTLERFLSKAGFEVLLAESGAHARGILVNQSVDIVMTDLRMPGENGVDLLTFARQHSPRAVRILITGKADADLMIRAVNEGDSDYVVTKPWNNAELLQVLKDQLTRREMQRRIEALLEQNRAQNALLKEANDRLELRVAERTKQLKLALDGAKRSVRAVQESYKNTVRVILELSSMNGSIDSDLSKRMAELGVTLAKALKMEKTEIRSVHYACLLHELGKLGIPASIVSNRESLLSTSEWDVYTSYPQQGADALLSIDYLADVARLIANHREHWDGSGFPRQLVGEEIPLGSQIVLLTRDYVQALLKEINKKQALGRRAGNVNAQLSAFEGIEQWRDIRYSSTLLDLLKQTLAVTEVEEGGGKPDQGRMVSVQSLEPGMVLAQDIYTDKDLLMLTKGQVLSARHIEKLVSLETEYQRELSIYIEMN